MRVAAIVEAAGQRDGDAVVIVAADIAMFERNALRGRIDIAAQDDAPQDQPLAIRIDRIEHDCSAADRKHPGPARLRGRGKLRPKRVARRA
jgi:hypothetical protein